MILGLEGAFVTLTGLNLGLRHNKVKVVPTHLISFLVIERRLCMNDLIYSLLTNYLCNVSLMNAFFQAKSCAT